MFGYAMLGARIILAIASLNFLGSKRDRKRTRRTAALLSGLAWIGPFLASILSYIASAGFEVLPSDGRFYFYGLFPLASLFEAGSMGDPALILPRLAGALPATLCMLLFFLCLYLYGKASKEGPEDSKPSEGPTPI